MYAYGIAAAKAAEEERKKALAPKLPGPLRYPGYGEDFYTRNMGRWERPGQAQNYWEGVKGWFNQPTTEGERRVQGYGRELGDTRGAIEGLYDEYYGRGDFTNPGAVEDWYGRYGGDYNAPSVGENAIRELLPEFYKDGAMERWWGQNSGRLAGPSFLESNQNRVLGDIDAARAMKDFGARNLKGLETKGYTERMADQYRPELSYSEEFLTGAGPAGLRGHYDSLYDLGSERLANEAGARGGYNTGAALRATKDLGKDLAGQEVLKRMELTNQADVHKMARLGEARGLMTAADTGLRERLGLGFQATRGMDEISLARAKAAQDLFTGMGAERRADVSTAGGLAASAQEAALNRLLGGVTAGRTEADVKRQRMDSARQAAESASQDRERRVRLGMDSASARDQGQRERLKTAAEMERAAQNDILARFLGGGDLSTRASNEETTRLTAGMNAATTAQDRFEGRLRGAFTDTMQLSDAQARQFAQGMDVARREQYLNELDKIENLLATKKISADEANARRADLMQWAMMPVNAAGGARPPGASPPAPSTRGANFSGHPDDVIGPSRF